MEVTRSITPLRAAVKPLSLDSASSSPPSSPPQSPAISDRECDIPVPRSTARTAAGGVGSNGKEHTHLLLNGASAEAHGKSSPRQKTATDVPPQARKKPGPKPKKDAGAGPDGAPKPPKERKPRKPRDPNAPPRKRQKLGDDGLAIRPVQQSSAHSSLATPSQLIPQPQENRSHADTVAVRTELVTPAFTQVGKYESEPKPIGSVYGMVHQQQPPASSRPPSSGQRYDPIRSASAENAMLRIVGSPTRLASTLAPNARASPSIASLIDPPSVYAGSRLYNTTSQLDSLAFAEAPSTAHVSAVAATVPAVPLLVEDLKETKQPEQQVDDVESESIQVSAVPTKVSKSSSSHKPKPDTPPGAASPKPARQKEGSVSQALGNGLLLKSIFSSKSEQGKKQYAEVPNQCIVIEVPLTQETGNYVNFIREVENKYGFDVAHPRLAEHRRRMAQMAAAGAALEPSLGEEEDMPADESDLDSNPEMGGMDVDDDSTAAEGKKKKKRKPRANEYDKHDDFIDDTEQLWEEQAMASNNGYFVWHGPLIPDSAKATDEKPEGTMSKRGRGRGRGGVTRGETSGRGRGRGGRGSTRGDGVTRKPRVTKAERAKLEIERQERENYAATAQKSATLG